MPVWLIALLILAGALGLALAIPLTRRMAVFAIYFIRIQLKWLGMKLGLIRPKRSNPALMRELFEDLGPTFIKFGQIIASSAGLFPKEWTQEFQQSLDRVRPFPFEQVQEILAAELGPLAARVAHVERKPLASASIAQVHLATLDDGQSVVVKVQRPGIARRIDGDMRVLRLAARVLATSRFKNADLANPVGIVEDFASTLAEELDFRGEAANQERWNEIMAGLGHTDVRAPRPVKDLTTPRVLVMERFHGLRVDDVGAIRARTVDAEERLVKGMRAWFQSVLFHGFFHGDVHAGNLMLLDDGAIGFLDFGIVGRFDARQRAMVTDYIMAFVGGDYRALANTIIEMGGVRPERLDLDAFVYDLDKAYAPIRQIAFGDLNYAELLPELQRVAAKHRMRLPKEFVLITKQMLYFDRYAKLLAPRLNVFTDPRLVMSLAADLQRAKAARGAAS